jgi:hypothetical protein
VWLFSISQIVFALRRKISSKQYRVAEYTLQTVAHLVKCCAPPIQLAIGSNFFLMELIRLIKKYTGKIAAAAAAGTENREKEQLLLTHMLDLVKEWFIKYDKPNMRVQYGNFVSVYYELVQEKIIQPKGSPKTADESAFFQNSAMGGASPTAGAISRTKSLGGESDYGQVEFEEEFDYEGEENMNSDQLEQDFRGMENGIAGLNFGTGQRSFEPFLENDYTNEKSASRMSSNAQPGFSIDVNGTLERVPSSRVGSTRAFPPKPSLDMNYVNNGNMNYYPQNSSQDIHDDMNYNFAAGSGAPMYPGYNKDVPSPHGSIMSELTSDTYIKGVTASGYAGPYVSNTGTYMGGGFGINVNGVGGMMSTGTANTTVSPNSLQYSVSPQPPNATYQPGFNHPSYNPAINPATNRGLTLQPPLSNSNPPSTGPSPLPDRMTTLIQLLKDMIFAATTREELCRDECARDLSNDLKAAHKELIATLGACTPGSGAHSRLKVVNDATMECLWGFDSSVEGKVPLQDVKATFRRSRALSTASSQGSTPTQVYGTNYGIPEAASRVTSNSNPTAHSPHTGTVYNGQPAASTNRNPSYGGIPEAPPRPSSTMYRLDSFYKPPASTISSPGGGSPGGPGRDWRSSVGNSGSNPRQGQGTPYSQGLSNSGNLANPGSFSITGSSSPHMYTNSYPYSNSSQNAYGNYPNGGAVNASYDMDDNFSTASSAVYGNTSIASASRKSLSGYSQASSVQQPYAVNNRAQHTRSPALSSQQQSQTPSANPFDDYT